MSNGLLKREEKRGKALNSTVKRKSRPKTFSSEESAKAYAEKNKIRKYSLKNLKVDPRSRPKIRIVEE